MRTKPYIQKLTRLRSMISRARILQIVAGLSTGWICFSNSAQALNGFSSVNTCSQCTTTANFVAGAEAAATQSGTYTMVSTAGPMTAFIQVTGHIVKGSGNPFFGVTAAVPVDASGNSIAGDSEAEQVATYTAVDAVIMGTNRNMPVGWPLAYGPNSFGCTDTPSNCEFRWKEQRNYSGWFLSKQP